MSPRRRPQPARQSAGAYRLIFRGADGRVRFEQFDQAGAYTSRLAALADTHVAGISIESLAGLLDEDDPLP